MTEDDSLDTPPEGEAEPDSKSGVKVECQMETSKQKTVTFEFHTTDIGPEEMANTFIREDLLAEQHRKILVEQLIDIAAQLAEDPETVPQVTFPPEECLSPTREKRERSCDSSRAPVEEVVDKEDSPPATLATATDLPVSSPKRGDVKEGREGVEVRGERPKAEEGEGTSEARAEGAEVTRGVEATLGSTWEPPGGGEAPPAHAPQDQPALPAVTPEQTVRCIAALHCANLFMVLHNLLQLYFF